MQVPTHTACRLALALLCVLVSPLVTGVRRVEACSCAQPRPSLLTPNRADAAPVNTKIRLIMPRAQDPANPQVTGEIVVRQVDGPVVAVASRRIPDGEIEIVELTPSTPLLPETTYEVEIVRATVRPAIYVIGTFTTGVNTDATPPAITRLAATRADPEAIGRTCRVDDTSLLVEVAAGDPGRPEAQILYGVWRADASGRIDPTRPPTTLLELERAFDGGEPELHVGRATMCDPRTFALPKSKHATLGIAAIDEAGNAGPVRTVVVRLPRAAR